MGVTVRPGLLALFNFRSNLRFVTGVEFNWTHGKTIIQRIRGNRLKLAEFIVAGIHEETIKQVCSMYIVVALRRLVNSTEDNRI